METMAEKENTQETDNNNTPIVNSSGNLNTSAAEDALAKAKAIAAKLAQTVPSDDQQAVTATKRKRWGNDTSSCLDDSDDKRSKLLQTLGGEVMESIEKLSKKIRIPVDKNPGYNYVGLLIGPGGSKQKALQAEAGGRVKIQVRGNGSVTGPLIENNPGGLIDEPLHVLLEGEKDCVLKAESLINELLQDSAKADAEKGRQLAELGITTSMTSSGDGASASSTYKPMPVAQIIGQSGSGSLYGNSVSSGDLIEEKVGVPNGVVGYIIGKGGESITSMQRRTGCRVQIQKEYEMAPNSNTRIITLSAATQEKVDECRTIIEQMVEERTRLNQVQQQSNQESQQILQQALSVGQQLVSVQVPDADVGLIIGKGGCNIRAIQDRSGANIQIPQQADVDNPLIRTCSITHPTLEGATFAKSMVEDILRTKTDRGGGVGGYESSIQVLIPDKDVGMIIGRQGCVIREMQSKTGSRIQIPSQPTLGMPNRVATVTGPGDGCQQVKQLIERMITEQSSQSVMAGSSTNDQGTGQQLYATQSSQYGGAYGAYGQQYQANANQMYGQQQNAYYQQSQGSQPQQQQYSYQQQTTSYGGGGGAQAQQQQQKDYSQEWAAYYAAQANQTAATTANATSASVASSTPATSSDQQASAQAPQDPTAYYDAFWRYAVYYGEEAARKSYGGWSPPAGTPNPYANATASTTSTAAAVGGSNSSS